MRFRDLRGIDFSNGKTAICDVKKRLFQNLINTSVYEDFCDPFRENSQKQSPEPIRKIAFCGWDSAKSQNLIKPEEIDGFGNPFGAPGAGAGGPAPAPGSGSSTFIFLDR